MAAGQAKGPESFLPRDLHVVEVRGIEVLDLTARSSAEQAGLSSEDLNARTWDKCQEVGRAAHYLGLQGVMAPSATGIGVVLAIFEATLRRGQLEVTETRLLGL